MIGRTTLAAAALGLLLLAVGQAAAFGVPGTPSLANKSFEAGNLSGWTLSPAAGVFASAMNSSSGVAPEAGTGSYFAYFTGRFSSIDASTLTQTFTANAGDTIGGWAFFDSGEPAGVLCKNDSAKLTIDGVAGMLWERHSCGVGGVGGVLTPWARWSYTFSTAGTYTLRASVVNLGGSGFVSGMGLDVDDAAPIIGVSDDKFAVAAAPSGTAVSYDAPTADDDDSAFAPTTACSPISGSVFPVGVTTVTCTATDSAGNQTQKSFSVTVTQNAPPELTLEAPPFGQLYAAPASVSLLSSFTDPGLTDTHTCTVDWDDGTPLETFASQPGRRCDGSHAYATAGVYTIVVTVTDNFGAWDSDSVMVVVYSGDGFVTGGGWISSQAGAYVPDPTLAGRANFGFVSRYQNGKSAPEGVTEFQFKLANLNFHSEVYEWLLVSGHKAQYKGSGTINGAGWYGFTVTIEDGQRSGGSVDKFRIQIRDAVGVVYDNGIGGEPQSLAGGSIVIHKG